MNVKNGNISSNQSVIRHHHVTVPPVLLPISFTLISVYVVMPAEYVFEIAIEFRRLAGRSNEEHKLAQLKDHSPMSCVTALACDKQSCCRYSFLTPSVFDVLWVILQQEKCIVGPFAFSTFSASFPDRQPVTKRPICVYVTFNTNQTMCYTSERHYWQWWVMLLFIIIIYYYLFIIIYLHQTT